MKKIELFWNIVFYNVYLFDRKIRRILQHLNPLYLINNVPFVKRHYAKHGIDDMNEFSYSILNNPKSGLSNITAGSFMGILLVIIIIGLLNLIEALVGRSLVEDVIKNSINILFYLIILMVPTILINQQLLFKKDKYLDYFREFEKMTDKKRTFHKWISFAVVIFIFSFTSMTFLFIYSK